MWRTVFVDIGNLLTYFIEVSNLFSSHPDTRRTPLLRVLCLRCKRTERWTLIKGLKRRSSTTFSLVSPPWPVLSVSSRKWRRLHESLTLHTVVSLPTIMFLICHPLTKDDKKPIPDSIHKLPESSVTDDILILTTFLRIYNLKRPYVILRSYRCHISDNYDTIGGTCDFETRKFLFLVWHFLRRSGQDYFRF